MATLPKWTDERTDELKSFVGGESPVSQDTVAGAAEQLETTTRSVSSKLRKMGYDVELASAKSTRAFLRSKNLLLQLLFLTIAVSIPMLRLQRTLKAEHSVLSLYKVRFFQWNLLTMLSQLPKWRLLEPTHQMKRLPLFLW